jgi:hypothetical protein
MELDTVLVLPISTRQNSVRQPGNQRQSVCDASHTHSRAFSVGSDYGPRFYFFFFWFPIFLKREGNEGFVEECTFPCCLSSAKVPEMLRLSSATAAAAAAAALTATTGAALRNETLPVAAARRLGPAAENDADPAAAALSAKAMADFCRVGGWWRRALTGCAGWRLT